MDLPDTSAGGAPKRRSHYEMASTTMVAGGSPPVLRNAIASQLFPEHRFSQTR